MPADSSNSTNSGGGGSSPPDPQSDTHQTEEKVREITATDHINKALLSMFKSRLDNASFSFPAAATGATSSQDEEWSEDNASDSATNAAVAVESQKAAKS